MLFPMFHAGNSPFMPYRPAQPTFYFHDYETFGQHPARDRPAQFAGVRTDMDFNIIEEPLVIYCTPADDYLPEPDAVLITGITPQQATVNGVNEAEFSHKIHQAFSVAGSCVLDYNSIRFDDEVSRNIFYRNFYDPYAYSWQNGNSRWDLLDVTRACYALRPDGIVWPKNADGLPDFKLESLASANMLEHNSAHDALSDVHATIALAGLLKQAQPRLFHYLCLHRNKHKINELIDIADMRPLVHISGMFGAARGNATLVAPLAWHPENKNAVIMCDLAGDISVLLQLDADTLRERLYTRRDALDAGQQPVPIKLLHSNKCPVLAPAKTLRAENAQRLGIDSARCRQNLRLLRQNPQIREKVVALFSKATPFATAEDVDSRLYDGFFGDADRATMTLIRRTQPHHLATLTPCFQDARLKTLFFRYRARNYPYTLSKDEQQHWLQHQQERLRAQQPDAYLSLLTQLCDHYAGNHQKLALLRELFDYAHQLFEKCHIAVSHSHKHEALTGK